MPQQQKVIVAQMGNCQNEAVLFDAQQPVLGRLGAVGDLRMARCRWDKDYQGLFDYDSKQLTRQALVAGSHCLAVRHHQHVEIKDISMAKSNPRMIEQAVFQIIRRPNFYKIWIFYSEIAMGNSENPTRSRTLCLRKKYRLREKDIIKLGKQKIKIRQIVHVDSHSHANDHQNIHTLKKIYQDLSRKPMNEVAAMISKQQPLNEVQSVQTENQPTCRICLQPGQHSNPLICPCQCLGSVRHIHLKCLRDWLGRRLHASRSKHSVTIRWTPLSCQMCRATYKYRIYLDNKKHYTVEIPRPQRPYIVMQVLNKNAQNEKIFHFVSCSQLSKLSIGRKKEIDIKLSDDISISRHHGNLSYNLQDKEFTLQDNKSKFGTLVLVKRNLVVNPLQRGIGLQVGGEIYLFQTHRTQGAISQYHDHQEYLNLMEGREHYEEDSQEGDQLDEEENQQVQLEEIGLINNSSQVVAQSQAVINSSQLVAQGQAVNNNNNSSHVVVQGQQIVGASQPSIANISPSRLQLSPLNNQSQLVVVQHRQAQNMVSQAVNLVARGQVVVQSFE